MLRSRSSSEPGSAKASAIRPQTGWARERTASMPAAQSTEQVSVFLLLKCIAARELPTVSPLAQLGGSGLFLHRPLT